LVCPFFSPSHNWSLSILIPIRIYGATLYGVITAAFSCYCIMCGSGDSYDFDNLDGFVQRLRKDYDVVTENRFKGSIEPEAMPLWEISTGTVAGLNNEI